MRACRLGAFASLLLACANPALAQDAVIDRGRAIFLSGTGIEASLGRGISPVPGSSFACKNCHGMDAAGKREGNIEFPPIAWKTLTTPDASRPAYDRETFGKAITTGLDPNDRPLSEIMPRYHLAAGDVAALAAFLEMVEREQRSGISTDEIVFAVPATARFGALATSLANALNTQFSPINSSGGIYDRRLKAIPLGGEITPETLNTIFVTLGLVSDDVDLKDLLLSHGVPLAFPFSPPMGDEDTELVQGGSAAIGDMIAALVERIGRDGNPITVCHGNKPFDAELAALAEQQTQRLELTTTTFSIDSCPAAPSVLLLVSNPDFAAAQLPPGNNTALYGLLDQLAPSATALRTAGYRLILANPRPNLMHRAMQDNLPLADAQAGVIAPLVTTALLNSGRDLTRARFMTKLLSVLNAAPKQPGETVELLELDTAP